MVVEWPGNSKLTCKFWRTKKSSASRWLIQAPTPKIEKSRARAERAYLDSPIQVYINGFLHIDAYSKGLALVEQAAELERQRAA